MSSKNKEDSAINQQIEELRERMRVLQNDRKANIDVLEANKNANKDEITKLRDENKDLRKKLAQLSKSALGDNEKDEIKHLEKEVDRLRRLHDEYRLKSTRNRKELDGLKDTVKDLELDSQRPHMEDNQYTRNIRNLENKLDKSMIKYNEAQNIRKTYEQILKRLLEERVGYDNQLSALERTLASKIRDYEELLLLSGDANHARETALNELERIRNIYESNQHERDKELKEKHHQILLRKQMLERIKHREKLRSTLLSGGGNTIKPMSPSNELNQSMLLMEKIENKNKINIFENAFRKIKEATGVSDVNEVIQKIISQESTTENLINITRENQNKIEALIEMKKKIKSHCEELKYSGIGGGQHRKIVDNYEDQLSNASAKLERCKLKYDRLSKIVISMKAGVGHLQDKFELFRIEIGGKTYIISDETVIDALHDAELCFSILIKRIKAGEDEAKRIHLLDTNPMIPSPVANKGGLLSSPGQPPQTPSSLSFLNGTVDALLQELDSNSVVNNLQTIRPYNQRIDLNFNEDKIFSGANNNNNTMNSLGLLTDGNTQLMSIVDDASLGELDDDELTRDKVKRASTQILLAMDKKKKKQTKKKGSSNNMEEEGGSNKSPFRPN